MTKKLSIIDTKVNLGYEPDEEPNAEPDEKYDEDKFAVMNGYKPNDFKEPTCWKRFQKFLRSLWATKQTEDLTNDKKLYINTTIRELVIYIFFLIVLAIVAFGMRSGYMYYFKNMLSNLFLSNNFQDSSGSFSSMNAVSDMWKFLTGPLLNYLYWNNWYNGDTALNDKEQNFIYYENKLIGVPRIRQVRMENKTCAVSSIFRGMAPRCFPPYAMSSESKAPFALKTSPSWVYTAQSVLETLNYEGDIATYGGGGYYVDLKTTFNESLPILMDLFNNTWINRGTRAVIVDFTVYNANINLFCIIKLVGEFPAFGGVLPSSEFRIVKLIRYVNPFDFFVLACEILLIIFVVYYIIEEIIEIVKHRTAYFNSIWNVLDVIVLICCSVSIIFNVYRTILVNDMMKGLLANDDKHSNFDNISFWQLQFDNLMAFIVFLAMVKIFKYISFNKMMTQLLSTLRHCLKDLIGFSLMFFIIFIAFAQAACLIFGTLLADYRDFHICIYTLFRIILNDCNFQDLRNANSILGPLFFILYVFFVFFILFNMFLAILDDAYCDMREKLENEENEFEIAEFIREKTEALLLKLNIRKEKITNIQNALERVDQNKDGVMDFNEWKTELKERGYADAEIEALFSRYDIDGNRVLDRNEQNDMLKELNYQKISLENELNEQQENLENLNELETVRNPIPMCRYDSLCRRVDFIDQVITKLMKKFDIIMENFQNIDQTRTKGRLAMERMLECLLSMDACNEQERKQKLEEMISEELQNLNQQPATPALSMGPS